MRQIYYYETPSSSSPRRLYAEYDDEAKQKMPNSCIYLYKESDTKDGTPFIEIYKISKNLENPS